MWILLTVIVAGSVLLAYTLIEKQINQRPCPTCGFAISVDALPEECPRCGEMVEPRQS